MLNKRGFSRSALCVLLTLLCLKACSSYEAKGVRNKAFDSSRKMVVLDSGHNPPNGGALGSRGISEVVYNDHLTSQVYSRLSQTDAVSTYLTRIPNESLELLDRSEKANQLEADLFLSIHHDSAQTQFLKHNVVDGLTGWSSLKPIRGFSLFISRKNASFDQSFKFARLLADELLALGRRPTLHHAENIKGERKELLDSSRGIYRYDDLIVLKKTQAPAVLLEAGVIVDSHDEMWLAISENQKKMAGAIERAIHKFFEIDPSYK